MASEQGYTNQKKKGKAQFKTIHPVNSNGYGESVIPKYLADKSPGTNCAVDSVTEILGNNGQVEFWEILFDQTVDAIAGDVIRFKGVSDPKLFNFEFDVIEAISSDTLRVLPISDVVPTIGDTIQLLRFVTAASDDGGNPQISLLPQAVKYSIDGNLTDVFIDTSDPLNNKYLPVADADAQAILSDIYDNTMDPGFVDSGNTYATPLGANAVYTGDFVLISRYAAINVGVKSDVASASGGVKVEFSADGVNVHHSHSTTYSGGNGVGYIFNCEWQYARVVYTNGPVAQTSFIIQTILKQAPVTSSLYTLSQTVNSNMFAALGRSIITGETSGGGGGYANVKVTPSGALTVEAAVTGSVSVTNPSIAVTGSVSVTNPSIAVTGTFWPTTQTVDGTVTANTGLILPASLGQKASASSLAVTLSSEQEAEIGIITETAPATDTASSGLNGRLQRIAQRLTSLIDLFPTSIGTKTSAASLSVVLASDQAAVNVTPQTSSGTITNIQKSVGTSAVRATVSGSAPSATRKKLMIKPSKNNTGSIFLGSSSVTTASGLEIIGPDRLEFTLDASDYYLISDTAAQVVEIIEVA
jgi:hypothetical protein